MDIATVIAVYLAKKRIRARSSTNTGLIGPKRNRLLITTRPVGF
jgi:hypothetical protein